MRKTSLFAAVLFVTLCSTGCSVNNFAVQELNEKARAYIEHGEYHEAIARLKSGLDLDNTSFETYYNLAFAYSKLQDYASAVRNYTEAIRLKPDFADAYYSAAVSEENLVKDILSGAAKLNELGEVIYRNPQEFANFNNELPFAEKKLVNNLLLKSVEDYQTYLKKSPGAKDRQEVEDAIWHLKEMQNRYGIDQSVAKRL